MTKYCKLAHCSVKVFIHKQGKKGKCPYNFKCMKKHPRVKPKCKYEENL